MVTVDEIIQWPTTIRCFKQGSCHLRSTTSDEELHAFAARIGLRREWFQRNQRDYGERYYNHYDLTAGRRSRALELGATFVPGREQARAVLANRRGWADFPVGTRAYAGTGGYWERVERGWKWCTGDVFPTPGADVCRVELPTARPEYPRTCAEIDAELRPSDPRWWR